MLSLNIHMKHTWDETIAMLFTSLTNSSKLLFLACLLFFTANNYIQSQNNP